MSIPPVDKTPLSQAPAALPANPPVKTNDHDADDGAAAVKPALDKGVGVAVDKTA